MASHLKLPFTQCFFLLLSYVAATVVAEDPGLSHRTSQHTVAYDPQPKDFPNERLYRAYLVIQRFKNTITYDPKNITATWTGRDICGKTTYLGFYCATLPGQAKKLTVTAAIFNGFGLHSPKLQGFIDQLPDLALFHAASNNFGGDIPRLAGLAYPYKLNVGRELHPDDSHDGIADAEARGSGQLFECITAFFDLNFHVRRGNGSKIGMRGVTDAKALLLNYNNLSGPLPADLGFSKLSYLALAHNKLTGPIPASIAQAQDWLRELLLLNNQLSGCLPHELGMLSKTAVIDAGMNQITGPIPASFSCLTNVEQLNLAGNRLYGEVPDALCQLAGPGGRLANLSLSGNYFTSLGPVCSALIKGGALDVRNNCIQGCPHQRQPEECASFLRQPKVCPMSTHAACRASDVKNAVAPAEGGKGKAYSSYVTYATLHA